MTTKHNENHESGQPLGLACNDEPGPWPGGRRFKSQTGWWYDESVVGSLLAAERERCMGAMDSHGRYWVENRSRIIDAVTAAGLQIMSSRDRCWLAPLGPNVE
jgi:hypothetical protein